MTCTCFDCTINKSRQNKLRSYSSTMSSSNYSTCKKYKRKSHKHYHNHQPHHYHKPHQSDSYSNLIPIQYNDYKKKCCKKDKHKYTTVCATTKEESYKPKFKCKLICKEISKPKKPKPQVFILYPPKQERKPICIEKDFYLDGKCKKKCHSDNNSRSSHSSY